MSVPSKPQQSKTQTARVNTLLRPSPRRRSSCSAQGLSGAAPQAVPHQDRGPCLGSLPLSHRKAHPAPSLGRARGLSSGGPQTLPTSRGRRLGTTWRRASRHVSLRRTQGEERPPLRSSSPGPLRNCKTQGPCAATAAHQAQLPIQARMPGCASASTSQGSTGPRLRSSSGLRAWDAARAHLTAMFACLLACRAWRPPISATCGAPWRLRRPGTAPSWRRWRRSSRNHLDPQSLPRLREPVAREEQPLHHASSAAPTFLQQQNQLTFSKFI